ncbi:MAG: hypothetical protein RL071_2561 [Pseudomonadota bacterium]
MGPSGWITGSGALLLYLGLARLLGGTDARKPAPLGPLDLALGALAALITGLGTAWWMPRYFMRGFALSGSDFNQYCDVVLAVAAGRADVNPHRGWAGAVLPALLMPEVGVIGGLALGAALAMGIYGAALYAWGRAVHSRLAGLAAATAALSVAPLVLMARTTSFYPMGVALSTAACAGAALCVRAPGLASALACGVACGLALLVDVRAVFWVLAALGVAALGLLRPLSVRALVWLPALALPLVLSYRVAASYPTKGVTGLDRQTWSFVQVALHQLPAPPATPPPPTTDFWWGRDGLRHLPQTLVQTREMMAAVPPEVRRLPENVRFRREQVLPWVGPALVAAALTLFGLLRRPWAVLALLPLAAHVASLKTAIELFHLPRYSMSGAAGLPLVLGLAWATAASGKSGLLPRPLRAPAAFALLVLIIIGGAPSHLSPVARWRIAFSAEQYPRALMTGDTPSPDDQRCADAHAADVAAGRTFLWSTPATLIQTDNVDPGRDMNPSGAPTQQLPGDPGRRGPGPAEPQAVPLPPEG